MEEIELTAAAKPAMKKVRFLSDEKNWDKEPPPTLWQMMKQMKLKPT